MARLDWQSYRSLDESAELLDRWRHFVESRSLSPDKDSAWLKQVWSNISEKRALHVETCWEGQELVGVAPMVVELQRQKGTNLRLIKPLNTYHQLRGGQFLVDDQHASRMIDELLTRLNETHVGWSMMNVMYRDGEPQQSAFEDVVSRRGYPYVVKKSHSTPYLKLAESWDAQYAQMRKKFRYELRTREKKLRELGNVEVKFLNTVDTFKEGLSCIESIEAVSWKASDGLPITDPRHWGFYRRYAEFSAQRGELRLPILFLNDEPIAFDYGICSKGTYYLLQTSYKQQWADSFPGFVLRKLVIESLFDGDVSEINLGGGVSTWKAKWTKVAHDYVVYTVFSKSLKGRYLNLLGRLAERLRATRHQLARGGDA
ncbi:MAG: GNAT family N-acetyltransferase [Pseudomonadota bacterium]